MAIRIWLPGSGPYARNRVRLPPLGLWLELYGPHLDRLPGLQHYNMFPSTIVNSDPCALQPPAVQCSLRSLFVAGPSERLGPHLLSKLRQLLLAGPPGEPLDCREPIWANSLVSDQSCRMRRYPIDDRTPTVKVTADPILEANL